MGSMAPSGSYTSYPSATRWMGLFSMLSVKSASSWMKKRLYPGTYFSLGWMRPTYYASSRSG